MKLTLEARIGFNLKVVLGCRSFINNDESSIYSSATALANLKTKFKQHKKETKKKEKMKIRDAVDVHPPRFFLFKRKVIRLEKKGIKRENKRLQAVSHHT